MSWTGTGRAASSRLGENGEARPSGAGRPVRCRRTTAFWLDLSPWRNKDHAMASSALRVHARTPADYLTTGHDFRHQRRQPVAGLGHPLMTG